MLYILFNIFYVFIQSYIILYDYIFMGISLHVWRVFASGICFNRFNFKCSVTMYLVLVVGVSDDYHKAQSMTI